MIYGTINNEKILAKDSLDLMTNFIPYYEDRGYGLGLFQRTLQNYNKPIMGHGGNIDGFGSEVYYSIDKNVTVAVFCNSGWDPVLLEIVGRFFQIIPE